MSIHPFPAIASLSAGGTSQNATIGIDFNDSTNAASLFFVASGRTFPVQIQPRLGELLRPVSMTEVTFEMERQKLRGMNEMDPNQPRVSPKRDCRLLLYSSMQKTLVHFCAISINLKTATSFEKKMAT